MVKHFFLSLCLLALFCPLSSAQQLTGQQRSVVMERLSKACASVASMQCSFVQTKTSSLLKAPVVSKGVMSFVAPNKLHWEYTEPDKCVIEVQDDSVRLERNGVVVKPVPQALVAMSKMVMGCISGRQVFDEKDFDVAISEHDVDYQVLLTPRRRAARRVFETMTLSFDKKTSTVTTVVLSEKNGSTQIVFKHLQ